MRKIVSFLSTHHLSSIDSKIKHSLYPKRTYLQSKSILFDSITATTMKSLNNTLLENTNFLSIMNQINCLSRRIVLCRTLKKKFQVIQEMTIKFKFCVVLNQWKILQKCIDWKRSICKVLQFNFEFSSLLLCESKWRNQEKLGDNETVDFIRIRDFLYKWDNF